jgi:pimeloyl-ACP methyl ester carboxylesterase
MSQLKNDLSNLEIPGCWAKVGGLSIYYKCLGKGPALVLIHGGGNDWHEWIKNLNYFARSFQVYAPDFPGFGLSQSPDVPVSLSWSVEFLKNFLESLKINNIHLIGHSIGAMISIIFAAHYPELVKKLVLIDPSGLGKLRRTGSFLLSIFRILDRCQGKKKGPEYPVRPVEEWQVLDELPKINCPTLVIWGQNDIYLPVSQSRLAQALIPCSQLYIFPHCGHAPQREYPSKFNNLVAQFLGSEDEYAKIKIKEFQ